MNRPPVRSSNIRSADYDQESRTLEVEFYSSRVCQYTHVPKVIHQGLMRAASKGSYIHNHINGRHSDWQLRQRP